jgi:chemotaxis protein histidine kinase CheA
VYTEEDLGKLGLSVKNESDEDNQEKSLKWLLDMDLSEPEEKLFTVADNEYQDAGLSASEAEVAARPLERGHGGGDDLSNYVAEEIVISSDNTVGDIYAGDSGDGGQSADGQHESLMAIDYSSDNRGAGDKSARGVDEGTDILGLAGDDDIGEKFLSIKRVRRARSVAANDVQQAQPGAGVPQSAAGADGIPGGVAAGATGQAAGEPVGAEIDAARDAVIATGLDPAPGDVSGVADIGPYDLAGDAADPAPGDLVGETVGDSLADNLVEVSESGDDDEAFAQYLLAREAIEQHGAEPEELVLALSEGDALTTLSVDVATDVQDDFLAVEGFAEEPAPDVGVEVEVEAEIEVEVEAETETEVEAETKVEVEAVSLDSAVAELAADGGFGEDIFGEDFNEEFSAQLEANAGAEDLDIEEVFSGLGQEEGDFAAGIGDDCVVEAGAQPLGDLGEGVVIAEGQPAPVVAQEAAAPMAVEAVAEEEPEPVVAQAVPAPVAAEMDAANEALAQDTQMEPAAEEMGLDVAAAAAVDNAYPDNFIPDYIDFSFTSQSNAEIFADFLDAFIEEGSVEVEKLEHEVGEWEKEITSESLLAKVSRTLHTIKGIAKGVGLQRLGTLVHNFETLLEKMPKPVDGDQQHYFRVVNAWLDSVVRGFEHVQANRTDIDSELPVHTEQARREVEAVSQEAPAPASETASPRKEHKPEKAKTETASPARAKAEPETVADAAPVQPIARPATTSSALDKKRDKQLADEGAKVLAAQQSVRITSEKLDHLLNLTSQVQQLGVRASQSTSRSKRSSAELQARLSSVRTHIRKIADRALLNVNAQPGKSAPDLDALEMDQYSELQEAANILREGVEDLTDLVDVLTRQNIQIETLLKQQSSVISSISSSIQGARVVPVSRLMPGLRRIVRTVSTDLGKVVSFQVLNETGALDRDHYARLQVILEHMVRNALDHGIESPDERVAVGKPTGGRITIDVRKSGGDYVIRLADDGRGIDPDAIRQSALEKGIDVDVDALSDDEAVRLIFHKGFSTASKLSEISGRGVGMDIVLTELQQLGGDVQIQSAVGLGTAFEVRIPSNVSVNGALLVAAGGESYAVPLNGLIGVEQVPVDVFFGAVERQEKLVLADMECEATYLATLCQGVPLPSRSVWSSFVPVIVAGAEERCMAIAIDNVEEALELVVRSMGAQFSSVPGVAGAATTAEGEAIVALDLNLMVLSAGEDGIAPVAVSQAQGDVPLALVVDDSRTQRMVATSQLESVGVDTITAENGLVAIDLLNAAHRLPDVILLDVEMPVKDGIETLREIRKSSRYGKLPVIMVTSRTGAKHRALASEAGCNAYMGKPFNFAALTKQINELTGLELQAS